MAKKEAANIKDDDLQTNVIAQSSSDGVADAMVLSLWGSIEAELHAEGLTKESNRGLFLEKLAERLALRLSGLLDQEDLPQLVATKPPHLLKADRLAAEVQARAKSRSALDLDQADVPHNSHAVDRLRINSSPVRRRRGAAFPTDAELARDRHPQRDFWLADVIDIAFKDDVASMEAPVYALSKRPDKREATWVSPDGNKKLFVFETKQGRATIFDKDILIYATSQMTAALNDGKPVSRTMRYRPYDFFVTTNRDTGGDEYVRHKAALERLQGTSIQTNIATGGVHITRQFSLIESWEIIEKDEKTGRATSVAITLNEWMVNAIAGREVLTMNKDYFRLGSPMDRRLYELARKHGFTRGVWVVSWDNLYSLTGSVASMKEFRRGVREAQERDVIPDFMLMLDDDGVTFKRHPTADRAVDNLLPNGV